MKTIMKVLAAMIIAFCILIVVAYFVQEPITEIGRMLGILTAAASVLFIIVLYRDEKHFDNYNKNKSTDNI